MSAEANERNPDERGAKPDSNRAAERLYRRIVEAQPDYADAWQMLGVSLFNQGRSIEAAAAFSRAAALSPDRADYQHNLGLVLAQTGDADGAIAALTRASQLDSRDAGALFQLGNVYAALRRSEPALESFSQAVARRPDFVDALNNLGMMLIDVGRVAEALDGFNRALAVDPSRALIDSNRVFALHFHLNDPAAILAEHRIWNRRHAAPLASEIRPHENDRNPDRRLRIGYLSPDFFQHCQALYTIPLFSRHAKGEFEIYCYADVPNPDSYTREIRSHADVWRETAGKTDAEVARMIRDDRIDVLVDLTMHMLRARPLVMARKPAPVQIAWLAYPSTTGLETIDYRLTDPNLDPPGVGDEFYTEKSIRLPDTFWCFDPLSEQPPVNPLPALTGGAFTFGCLNNFCKVNDDLLRIWSAAVNAVPGSRLLMLTPEGSARRHVLEVTGLAAERVDFVPIQPRPRYLETYHRIDLGLDTFPYNGHTASLDSLWMGVPVVTRMGKTAVSRAGLSQTANLGLTDLVARTPEEFVKLAVAWASDLPRLADLRSKLRPRMAKSPLMDSTRFARNIEAVYRDVWRTWCKGNRS